MTYHDITRHMGGEWSMIWGKQDTTMTMYRYLPTPSYWNRGTLIRRWGEEIYEYLSATCNKILSEAVAVLGHYYWGAKAAWVRVHLHVLHLGGSGACPPRIDSRSSEIGSSAIWVSWTADSTHLVRWTYYIYSSVSSSCLSYGLTLKMRTLIKFCIVQA